MKEFTKKLQVQFDKMCRTGKLFRSRLTAQEVWNLYIKSFTKEDNPVFRDPLSSSKNCNCCSNFIRRYGNIVAIDEDYNIMTIFDILPPQEYRKSCREVTKAIIKTAIGEVFFETFKELMSLPYESCGKLSPRFQLGVDKNYKKYTLEEANKYGVVEVGEVRTFDHLHLFTPRDFVDFSGKSVEAIMGEYRDAKNVFQRAMETISLDTLELVRDLINQGSLLDGQTHLYKIEQFIPLKKEYDEISPRHRDNWCWAKSYKLPFAKFKNELIGVLCSELSEGEELNKACQSWNKRVDPVNYMKTTAPITKKQIEEARKFVEENGYEESFSRRFATIDDIKVSEILHSNVGDTKVKSVSIFDGVKSTSTRHKRSEFDGVEEVSIDKFMTNILPSCSSIEALLSNSHNGNMVSLTTANNPDSKPIFKWSNNYSWTFNGNLAGKSQIKQAVKAAGGNVDGILNFRLAWNENGDDQSDLDLWAIEPGSTRIGFSSQYRKGRMGMDRSPCSGQLDVDIVNPQGKLAVENITWTDPKKMRDGVYHVYVHPYSPRFSKGFQVEIEFAGEVYLYVYNQPVSKSVLVANVTLKNGNFTIQHLIPESGTSSKEIYGLETNQFHKVKLLCLSPNHWGDNNVGNKHYFFMLEGCKSPVSIRSFHNENLIPELLTHRKVIEVLGSTNMIESTPGQLSGLGFNATVRDELIVRLQGTHKRVVKIKF